MSCSDISVILHSEKAVEILRESRDIVEAKCGLLFAGFNVEEEQLEEIREIYSKTSIERPGINLCKNINMPP